jgi:hypothetical protein
MRRKYDIGRRRRRVPADSNLILAPRDLDFGDAAFEDKLNQLFDLVESHIPSY